MSLKINGRKVTLENALRTYPPVALMTKVAAIEQKLPPQVMEDFRWFEFA